ncbi:MAG: hypothetical protein DRP93_02010 [Candidatus Neomarinimicrobiota bacterium]|nr:MAG: hypothetical protein DRP93_02010 [Candidatus Neomarinimicrobiota bacterium]
MKFLYQIAVFLIMLFWQLVANAQVDVISKLDTNAILVGDQVHLNLEISFPVDYNILWPELNDTIISEIEILEKSPIDTLFSKDKNTTTLKQQLLITCFDSGYYALPPVHFDYIVPNDPIKHFEETDAILLQVSTIAVDTTQAIKDIRAPQTAPITFREALPYILVGIAILIIAALLVYYFRKRKKEEPVFKAPVKPKLPPQQIAMTALDNLRLKKLWQSGQIKEYHTELTDIIRIYLDGKFNIMAMELTTDEIMALLGKTQINQQAQKRIRQVFQLADMVKFAKQQPLPLEHDSSLNQAIDFVKESMHLNQASHIPEKIDDKNTLAKTEIGNQKKEEGSNNLDESKNNLLGPKISSDKKETE